MTKADNNINCFIPQSQIIIVKLFLKINLFISLINVEFTKLQN